MIMCSNPSDGSIRENFDDTEIALHKMKRGLANLETHYGSISNDLCSLDEFQRLNVEGKLIRIRGMCEEFSESLTRMREDHKLMIEREGRIAERYVKLDRDHLTMVIEKNSTISGLKENLNQMKSQIEKRDVVIEECEQKIKEKDEMIEAYQQEIKGKNEIIEACQQEIKSRDANIEEMKLQHLQFQGTIDELRRSNSVDLRCKNLESDKVAATQHLNSRITRVEGMLSSLLNIKMDDLTNLSALVPSMENGEVAFRGSKGEKHDIKVQMAKDATQFSWTKIAGGETNNTVESSPVAGAESRFSSSQSYSRDAYPVRGSKWLRSPDINNIIEIIDDDDECPISHRKGMISEKTVQGGDECTKVSSISLSGKRKRSSEVSNSYHTPISRDKRRQIEDSAGPEDLEDESCSESCINALIESCRGEKLDRTWMFGTDMKKAFQEDDDLCLNAVCVLHRQQITPSESSRDFPHFRHMSGKSLAEYLINGEPCLKLRKSASEVKQEQPDVINKCRRLALAYYEQLFSIYCTRKDPYFN